LKEASNAFSEQAGSKNSNKKLLSRHGGLMPYRQILAKSQSVQKVGKTLSQQTSQAW
jgi:hypothetical protein